MPPADVRAAYRVPADLPEPLLAILREQDGKPGDHVIDHPEADVISIVRHVPRTPHLAALIQYLHADASSGEAARSDRRAPLNGAPSLRLIRAGA